MQSRRATRAAVAGAQPVSGVQRGPLVPTVVPRAPRAPQPPVPRAPRTSSARPPAAVGLSGRFVLGERLGRGTFGVVFRALDMSTGTHAAVKLEAADSPKLLALEAKLLRRLGDAPGFARLLWTGDSGTWRALAMTLLGPSLSDIVESRGPLPLIEVRAIAHQLLQRLSALHNLGVAHRDVKPHNICLGYDARDAHTIYLVDFGLARELFDRHNRHVPNDEGRRLVGSSPYASLAVHNGTAATRRDDIESLVYSLLAILRGRLPWSGLPGNNEERRALTATSKRNISPEELAHNDGVLPFPALASMLHYARSLKHDELPDFEYLVKLIDMREARRHIASLWERIMGRPSEFLSRRDSESATVPLDPTRDPPPASPASPAPTNETLSVALLLDAANSDNEAAPVMLPRRTPPVCA